MEELVVKMFEMIMWVIGGISIVGLGLFGVIWRYSNNRFEKIDAKFDKIDLRFDALDKDIRGIKDDMIEIKTILKMKECCMIQDERRIRKAE